MQRNGAGDFGFVRLLFSQFRAIRSLLSPEIVLKLPIIIEIEMKLRYDKT